MTEVVAGGIPIDTFAKCDLRVGTITKVERIEKSEKIMKLEVDFGEVGVRVIGAGLAKAFKAEELLGRQVIGIVNLMPRSLFGFESHGMLLAGNTEAGGLALPTCAGVPNGTRLH